MIVTRVAVPNSARRGLGEGVHSCASARTGKQRQGIGRLQTGDDNSNTPRWLCGRRLGLNFTTKSTKNTKEDLTLKRSCCLFFVTFLTFVSFAVGYLRSASLTNRSSLVSMRQEHSVKDLARRRAEHSTLDRSQRVAKLPVVSTAELVFGKAKALPESVSYTHLTLPTN